MNQNHLTEIINSINNYLFEPKVLKVRCKNYIENIV